MPHAPRSPFGNNTPLVDDCLRCETKLALLAHSTAQMPSFSGLSGVHPDSCAWMAAPPFPAAGRVLRSIVAPDALLAISTHMASNASRGTAVRKNRPAASKGALPSKRTPIRV